MSGENKIIIPVIRLTICMIILCGFVYPFLVTGVAQTTMSHQANGSLLYNEENQVIGSELLGQLFENPAYFHGRISSINYQSEVSGSNNYAPSNDDLKTRVADSLVSWKEENPAVAINDVPIDLVTNSGSGLDPHITPEAAYAQIDRIASKTGITKTELQELVKEEIEHRTLGMLGEERVNVLQLNLALQDKMK